MSFLTAELMKGTDWRGLERAVARLMGHCGWRNVAVIGRSGDLGADVVGVRDTPAGTKTWVVQVKAVTGGSYVGQPALQEAMAAFGAYEAHVAAVATNGEFTKSARTLLETIQRAQFDAKLWNGAFLRALIDKCPSEHAGRRSLRPYQSAIVEATLGKLNDARGRAQYVVATGLGKTVIAAEIAARFWARGVRRILVLCHSQELANQLESGFWPQLPKEAPTRLFFDGAPPLLYEGVNFGLYQSLLGYLEGVDSGSFDLVIVDEAHNALSYGFRSCVERLAPRYLIGMTATPWRGDGRSLDELFGDAIARVSLVDGMEMGFLAQVDYRLYCDNVDWEAIPKLSKERLTIRDLNRRLFLPQRDDAAVGEVCRVARELPNPKIAVFSPSVDHCHTIAAMLTAAGIGCRPLSGVDRVERRRSLMEFGSGRLPAVSAVDVLNEGIDVPDVNIIAFMRATHSRRIFVQQLGRGLRLAPEKTTVVVLDFVSDLRRLAELAEMGRDLGRRSVNTESVYLRGTSINFTDQRVQRFIDAWLRDVTDLASVDDVERLKFPEIY